MFPAHNACTDKIVTRVASCCGDLLRQWVLYSGTVLSEQQKCDIDLAWEANARHLCGDHSLCKKHAESQAHHQGKEVTYFSKALDRDTGEVCNHHTWHHHVPYLILHNSVASHHRCHPNTQPTQTLLCTVITFDARVQIVPDLPANRLDLPEKTTKAGRNVHSWKMVLEWRRKHIPQNSYAKYQNGGTSNHDESFHSSCSRQGRMPQGVAASGRSCR